MLHRHGPRSFRRANSASSARSDSNDQASVLFIAGSFTRIEPRVSVVVEGDEHGERSAEVGAFRERGAGSVSGPAERAVLAIGDRLDVARDVIEEGPILRAAAIAIVEDEVRRGAADEGREAGAV